VGRGLGTVRGRIAVVTGAASGIGRATALALSARGAALGLADIDEPGLLALAEELSARGTRNLCRTTDVRDEAAVRAFASAVHTELGSVDLVVNSAGVAVQGDFLATSADDWKFVFDVNVAGAANVCRAFLPAIIRRGGGQIVNVASASAFATPPGLVAYGATKHALRGFSEGLRDELEQLGVGVTVVCPGFVDTPMAEHVRLRGYDDSEAERRRTRAFLRGRALTAERVAERIVRAAERGERLVPVGLEAHALHALARFVPSAVPLVFRAVRRAAARLRDKA